MSKKKKEIQEHQRKRLEEISLFIKNWRINEGLTQLELSKLTDTHVNTIQKFEKHNNNISVITLFACIDAMDGITLSQFFEGIQ
jgi:transcriptional regulator with XRE-family HTH domain